MGALNTRTDPATVVTGKVVVIKVNVDEIIFTLQATSAVSGCSGQEFLPVFCHEDGSRSSWTSQCSGQTKCGGIVFSRICHLQRGTGTQIIIVLMNLIYITPSLSQAYPEYLVTYLIVKPEARVDDEISAETP